MHGQPQASIAFMEIDQIANFKARSQLEDVGADSSNENKAHGLSTEFKSPPENAALADKNWFNY